MSKDNQKMTGDSVYRVKMYKDGKKWVYAGATTLALAAGLVFANVNASADTTNNGSAEPQQEVVTNDAGSASQGATTATTAPTVAPAATAAKTAPTVAPAAAPAATAAPVTTEAPVANAATTAPTSAPTVTAPAAETANKVTDTNVATTDNGGAKTTSTGTNHLQDNTQYIQQNVDGTDFSVTAGHTYNVAVRVAKNSNLDWSNVKGQVSIAPKDTNNNGTWTAVEYATQSGKEYSFAPGANTAVVDMNNITDADTYFTVLYQFVANDDATTGSKTSPLVFTGSSAVNALSTNKANVDTNQLIEAWSYATQVEDASIESGSVAVVYVDENGNSLGDGLATVAQGDVGTGYTVTPATFSNYTLDTAKSSALTGTVVADPTANGKVTDAGTYVTLVFKQNTEAAQLTVNAQDANGNDLLPAATYTAGADGTAAQANGTYEVTAPELDGYTLTGYKIGDGEVQTGNVAKNVFVAGNNDVTFIYAAVPVTTADVTVNYVDANGVKLQDSTVTTKNVGDGYEVTAPEIDGYTYDEAASDSLTGTVVADGNTINVVYTKNAVTPVAKRTVTVNYLDEAGNLLRDATSAQYSDGDTYNVDTPLIDGYTYKSADTPLSGTVAGDTTVNLTYTKNGAVTPVDTGTVTVKYVDENGDEIQPSTSTQYNVGDNYSVDTPAINGYTYKSASGDLSGTVAGDTVLTLTYGKNGASTTAPTTAPTDPDVTDPDTINPGQDNNNGGTTTAPATTPDTDTTASGDTLTATDNGTAGVVPTNAVLKPVVSSADQATKKSDATTLPQTDEENGTALAVLGLSTLVMGSALFFGATKRRKHQA